MKNSLLILSLLSCLLAVMPLQAQDNAGIIASLPPDRMWLPSDSEYLRSYLDVAVIQALENPDCKEMLYARVNEFRSHNADPVFTVLCMKDYKTTFNLVFPIAELDPGYSAPSVEEMETAGDETGSLQQEPLSPMLQELRQLLLLDENEEDGSAAPAEPVQQAAPAVRAPVADPESLDLDLEEMLRTPARRDNQSPAEIF